MKAHGWVSFVFVLAACSGTATVVPVSPESSPVASSDGARNAAPWMQSPRREALERTPVTPTLGPLLSGLWSDVQAYVQEPGVVLTTANARQTAQDWVKGRMDSAKTILSAMSKLDVTRPRHRILGSALTGIVLADLAASILLIPSPLQGDQAALREARQRRTLVTSKLPVLRKHFKRCAVAARRAGPAWQQWHRYCRSRVRSLTP